MDRVGKHATGFHRRVIVEIARRAGALLLLILAVVAGFGHGRWPWAALAVVLAALVYILLPLPAVPDGALHHERMPSVTIPDLLGFLLATTFLAMPFVISAQEPWLDGPWALMLFMWLPGLVALAIFVMAIRYQCFWVKLSPDSLTISTVAGIETLPFDHIAGLRPETRRPPRWLGPLLVLFGGWRGLGLALLHANTERHAILIKRSDGTSLRLPADAFPDINKVIKALARTGIALAEQSPVAEGRGAKTNRRETRRRQQDGEVEPGPS